MAIIKDPKEIEILKEAGKRLAFLVKEVGKEIAVGVTGNMLEARAKQILNELGDKSAFLGYRPYGAPFPYPAVLCVSVNEAIVHGIPNDVPFNDGDIVTVDCGLVHQGMYVDHAITFPVGKVTSEVSELLNANLTALHLGIEQARAGNRIGDIGFEIANSARGFGLVKDLAGHGVGRSVHEDPLVPNYGKKNSGEKISSGLVIAIEPMLTLGRGEIADGDDGYTIITADGSWSAHFEHTILITDEGPIIITEE